MNKNYTKIKLSGLIAATILLFGLVGFSFNNEKDVTNLAVGNNTGVVVSASSNSKTDASESGTEAKRYSQEELKSLATRFAKQNPEVVDVSEVIIDGAGTIVATFSVPLDPNQNFNQFIRVTKSDPQDKTKAAVPVEGGWELSPRMTELYLRYAEPDSVYNVDIHEKIKAINGKFIYPQESIFTVNTMSMWPSAGFTSRGSLLATGVVEGLPIIALNVNAIDVDFFRIKQNKLSEFLNKWRNYQSIDSWDMEQFLQYADLIAGSRFDLETRANVRENLLLPLGDLKPLQQPGIYLAVMRKAGTYYEYMIPVTLFTVSDVALSVNRSKNNLDVFTQNITNGKTLPGVKIQLLGENNAILAESTTNENGYARLVNNEKARVVYATTDSGQTSIVNLNSPALDLSEFNIRGQKAYPSEFFVFGSRDIYRPGEDLMLNALLRDKDGHVLPTRPVKVDIFKPDGSKVKSLVWQPQENGLYQLEYAIPSNAATGEWKVRFDLGDGNFRYHPVKVEDFLPERMDMTINYSKTPLVLNMDTINFDVSGRYLYGAPAAGNKIQAELLLRPLREAVPALPGYQFGSALEEKSLSRRINSFENTLDENGQLTYEISKDYIDNVFSPVQLILQASLLESGGRPIVRTVSQAIWPAEQMAGILPLFDKVEHYDWYTEKYTQDYIVNENSSAEFNVAYVNKNGEKIAGKLEVKLIFERQDGYWAWQGGSWEYVYNTKEITYDVREVELAKGESKKVSFPVDWGSYRVEVKPILTEEEVAPVTSIRFYAGYYWLDDSTGGAEAGLRPDQVKLNIDKTSYHAGDDLKVTVESPKAGTGYLLVESADGVLWQQQITVPEGGAQFTVPLDKSWNRHDLYLTAKVIRLNDQSERATPKRALGILHIPMADAARKINLSLTSAQKVEPNSALKVKVKAEGTQLQGKTVKVIVSAVDTGVLNITNFRTPDPYQAFFGQREYAIDMWDVYGQLIEGKGRLAKMRYGGDGEDIGNLIAGGKPPVIRVMIVDLHSDVVTLNEQGEAEISLDIPDFNGELRLMAQAWTDDDYGSAENKVTVAAPIIVELNTPRFLATNDTSRLALDIQNLSGQWQNAELTVKTDGLLDLVVPVDQKVTLDKDQKVSLNIPLKASGHYGSGMITVTIDNVKRADGTTYRYQRQWEIGVRSPYPAQTLQNDAILSNGQNFSDITDLSKDFYPEGLSAELIITSRPTLNVARYIRQLYAYPYGCLEQTVSGIYPSIYLNQAQLAAVGIKTEADDVRRNKVQLGITRIFEKQRSNGAFSLWTAEGSEEPWLTVYATDFLLRASEQGYDVPKEPLEKAISALLGYLQTKQFPTENAYNIKYLDFSVRSYAAYVLARQQKAPLGELRSLFSYVVTNADKVLSGNGTPVIREDVTNALSLTQLAIALKEMGDEKRSKILLDVLSADLKANNLNSERVQGRWYGDYGSSTRNDARMIAMMFEHNILADVRLMFVQKFIDNNLGKRYYYSTQENNALFLAGYYAGELSAEQDEPEWSVDITRRSTGQVETVTSNKLKRYSMDYDELMDIVSIKNNTDQSVRVKLNVNAYPRKTLAPVNQGIHITRTYYDLDGKVKNMSKLKSGDLLVVYIKVNTDNQRGYNLPDVLVVDLLPAGFELENQNLTNSASLTNNNNAPVIASIVKEMQQSAVNYQEFRDDRYIAAVNISYYRPATLVYLVRAVTPGTYSIPQPLAESMYTPEIRGTGETVAKITIK